MRANILEGTDLDEKFNRERIHIEARPIRDAIEEVHVEVLPSGDLVKSAVC